MTIADLITELRKLEPTTLAVTYDGFLMRPISGLETFPMARLTAPCQTTGQSLRFRVPAGQLCSPGLPASDLDPPDAFELINVVRFQSAGSCIRPLTEPLPPAPGA